MKNAVKRSLVANVLVLGAVVGGSRLFGVPSEDCWAVFWFQLVVQMLMNELWLYSSALPVLIVTFFHRKETAQERSALRAMKLISPVLRGFPERGTMKGYRQVVQLPWLYKAELVY